MNIDGNSVKAVVDVLREIIAGWNDDAEDDDRGAANDAIALIVYDDGSGFIAKLVHRSGLPPLVDHRSREYFGSDETLTGILERLL